MIVSSDLENGLEDAEKRRPKSVAQAISNQQAINVRKERWRTVPPRLTLSPEIIPRHSGFVLTVVLLFTAYHSSDTPYDSLDSIEYTKII